MTDKSSSLLAGFQKTTTMPVEVMNQVLDKDPEELFKNLVKHDWQNPLDRQLNKAIKRGFDIFFSLLILICFVSWMLPLLALLIKLGTKGPVFFKQLRTGMNNKNFVCWKLRSMHLNEEANQIQAIDQDPRITLIGRFLRKFSLDEMPQFYNVLIGNMTVVGPRPHMINHTELYSGLIDNYMARHFIRPGITGLSQVVGYRGEVKNPQMLRNRVRIDLFYLKKWSFVLDVKLILQTIKLVLLGDRNAF